jgi:hypothetical protein
MQSKDQEPEDLEIDRSTYSGNFCFQTSKGYMGCDAFSSIRRMLEDNY